MQFIADADEAKEIDGISIHEIGIPSFVLMERASLSVADQILVVDEGKIVQKGRHEELIGQKGIYADFVLGRKEAIGWKLGAR